MSRGQRSRGNTCRLKGKGEGEKGKKKPLPFNLFPKSNSKLKMLNRAVLGAGGQGGIIEQAFLSVVCPLFVVSLVSF
ncbi:hypothetical protein A6V25_14625 [Nostoc sp. ATCC 53789]|nr:hypothetical protein A6V25_14625 [Nostoc sp. ATCC 53789]